MIKQYKFKLKDKHNPDIPKSLVTIFVFVNKDVWANNMKTYLHMLLNR